MDLKFTSLLHVLDHFRDEKTCREYLIQKRWNGNITCPHCGTAKTAYVTNRGYKCSDADCHKKFTVITGTIFENTKISLRFWFAAMYLLTEHKKGISSLQLSRDLQVTQKTAWFILHRIREMLKNNSIQKMTGIVEADETYVGGKLANKHQSKRQKATLGRGITAMAPVVAVMERGGDVRAVVTDDVSSMSIYKILHETVEKGSTLITDGFTSYNFIGRQYNHIVVKHTDGAKKRYKVNGDKHTNNIEGFFSHLKRMIIGTYHFVSKEHLQAYCTEMSYRFSKRNLENGSIFQSALSGMNTRLRYVDLISR